MVFLIISLFLACVSRLFYKIWVNQNFGELSDYLPIFGFFFLLSSVVKTSESVFVFSSMFFLPLIINFYTQSLFRIRLISVSFLGFYFVVGTFIFEYYYTLFFLFLSFFIVLIYLFNFLSNLIENDDKLILKLLFLINKKGISEIIKNKIIRNQKISYRLFLYSLKLKNEDELAFSIILKNKRLHKFCSHISNCDFKNVELKIKYLILRNFFDGNKLLAAAYCSLLKKKETSFDYISNLFDYEKIGIDKSNFIITEDDFKRPSRLDSIFLKKYKMALLEAFGNACSKTGVKEEIEIDHFFIPKCQGGSFLLRLKNGGFFINAIPLNKTENILKSDLHILSFFSNQELLKIFNILLKLNNQINKDLIDQ